MISAQTKMCPSAPWNSDGAQVFGVVVGEAKMPKVLFLKQLLTPSQTLQDKLKGTAPEQVFRIAAPCAGAGCAHHNAATQGCNLVSNVVQHVDQVCDEYAVCMIRPQCVWWAQEGASACLRCPQIATHNFLPGKQVADSARPLLDRSNEAIS